MSKAEKSRATKATKRARGVLDGSKAVEARLAEGRGQRDAVPLDAHAEWTAPDDRLDDFDETLPAPVEWDVKRLLASIVVAARGNGYRRDHTFDRALESVAFAYADQNDVDYTTFSRAADDDRIAVQRGV